MDDELLQRAAGLPEITLAPGDTVVREGEAGEGLWILVSGALQITKAGVVINSITRPGAAIGEISLLLDSAYSATVVASEPSIVRFAADGRAFLMSDPAITRLIAVGLAERLNFVTTYLADLKHQYGDSPGLAMVSEVLGHLAHRQGAPARPGSAREPNPDY
ncbi:cyclic nucleotide-binding domain-containing protein [Variovorax saccharolyticus]|uniref:cyclic nucleotide-binding domain-containing protein n=1 Tax=Variovorax saccharolyticus TaxID=3053516 RepID=UPI00257910A4|nr:cyclic nucleotide-binding domain-containing protein [Variovorax sp. J22R187]MDM0019423.1 cyclic nucleotide-binding domain-containing protein [Variovorax sp. J22R187]